MPDAIVNGVPLVMLTIAGVEWIKKVGLQGKAALVASLGVGVTLGVGYQISQAMPTDFAGWFGAAVYGLGLGLTASGLYDAAGTIAAKAAQP